METTANSAAGRSAGFARPSVIQLNIKGVTALYLSYIPFFKNGGLFIPTTKDYKLGSNVYVLVTLPNISQRFAVTGKVGWITPAHSSGQRPQGIGVHFPENEQCKQLRTQIEVMLANYIPNDRIAHTV